MRRNLAILLLACATLVTAVACSSSSDTSTTGTTSTTKAAGDDKTSTTKAPLNPDGKKCSAVNNFLIAVTGVINYKPDPAKPDAKDKAATALKDAAANLKKEFPAKEDPDRKLRTDADAMKTYLDKVLAGTVPSDAEKTASGTAKDDMNRFKGLNCKKDDKSDTSSTEKAPASTTTTAKK